VTDDDDREMALNDGTALAVWGVGNIGASTFAAFMMAGVPVVGYDVSERQLQHASEQLAPLAPGCELTADRGRVLSSDVLVHLVALPTERDGIPSITAVVEVVAAIAAVRDRTRPPLIILESTLTPGSVDGPIAEACQAVGRDIVKDVLVAVAPRRDWMSNDLRSLDRVVGGTSARATESAVAVLGLICDQLHRSSSHREAELSKVVENAYRFLDISFSNQIANAYPQTNVREVLSLAATKWNVGLFQPGFGIGGHCVPLAPRYLIEGAANPQALSLIFEALDAEPRTREAIVVAVRARLVTRMAILGLSYRAETRISTCSPTIDIAQALKAAGVEVGLMDPYFSAEEIVAQTGAHVITSAAELAGYEGILVTAAHERLGLDAIREVLVDERASVRFVFDAGGSLQSWTWPPHVEYARPGDLGWQGATVGGRLGR
jgi:nucleotide sugar dehydrogenase